MNLDSVKRAAIASINTVAEQVRVESLTCTSTQLMVYQEKTEQAMDYISDNFPANLDAYPLIKAEVLALGSNPKDVATTILASRGKWIQLAAQVEFLRLKAKKEISDVDTEEKVIAVCSAALEALSKVER
jgi:hypothetical protein